MNLKKCLLRGVKKIDGNICNITINVKSNDFENILFHHLDDSVNKTYEPYMIPIEKFLNTPFMVSIVLQIVKTYDIDTKDLDNLHIIIRFAENLVHTKMQELCKVAYGQIGTTKENRDIFYDHICNLLAEYLGPMTNDFREALKYYTSRQDEIKMKQSMGISNVQ